MHLLDELREGIAPESDLPLGETLPTPVARVHHEGDADEPPSAVIPPPPRRKRGRPTSRPQTHKRR
jgi:hypothetical protein